MKSEKFYLMTTGLRRNNKNIKIFLDFIETEGTK